MDDDKTSLSGTQSNDTIIELTGAILDAKSNNDQASGKPLDPENDEDKNLDAVKQLSPESDGTDEKKKLPNLEPFQEDDKRNNAEARTPPVVSSGLMILDLLKLKKRKIGHRRVNEEGEITFKKIQTSWIVGSIQLGIGHAIGSLASKPERDLLMQDFAIVETTAFPREGGPATPAHHFSDFKFRAYAPVAFRHFRDLFGIRPDDFLLSLCDKPMVQLANPGASGSIFYVTDDDNFIVKTVDHREADFLQKLLPGYYMNVNQNPRTLLPKFFGLYCYQCSNKNIRLVVMNNLLPSGVRMHERYDLKGSTYKRKASRAERKKRSPTYKDLDYLERHPDGIHLDAETYSALVGTLRRDCRVLESFKIMDYSLLVGIHNVDAAQREKENENSPTRASGSGLTRSKSMNRQRLAAFSTAMESIRADVDVAEGDEDVPPGGIPARNAKGERLLLFLGIIDILQSFVLKKKLEHTFKAIVHDGDTVSVHRPGFYAQRFLDFMSNTVFKKASPLKHTPSRRNKGQLSRKVSAETEGVTRRKTRSESENSQKEPELSFMERHSNPESMRAESAAGPSYTEPIAELSFSEPVTEFSFKESEAKISFSESIAERSLVSPPRTIPLSVTWAETEVLELSQVVIETDSPMERGDISFGKWTPPHSVGGSTPTHTEGTPSLTESSPSPTTPSRSLGKSVDSLPPLEEAKVQ